MNSADLPRISRFERMAFTFDTSGKVMFDNKGMFLLSKYVEAPASHGGYRRAERMIDWIADECELDYTGMAAFGEHAVTAAAIKLDAESVANTAYNLLSEDEQYALLDAEFDYEYGPDLDYLDHLNDDDYEPECERYTDLLPEVDEDVDPACGGWGTSLDFEGWYGFHTFAGR